MDTNSSILPEKRAVSAVAALRRMAQPRPKPAPVERCELCRVVLAPEHRHLFETASRKITCSCDPCALRFESVLDGRFKLIPRDSHLLTDFRLDDAEWEALSLPINLAFFFHDSRHGRIVAYYPSPAGATESLLPLEAWDTLVRANPVLKKLTPDVETLLVNRVEERHDYYLAPIDVCFELVGLIRIHWRGLSGGEEVWRELDGYFARLREKARTISSQGELHA